jgi:hypothetical protein
MTYFPADVQGNLHLERFAIVNGAERLSAANWHVNELLTQETSYFLAQNSLPGFCNTNVIIKSKNIPPHFCGGIVN